jgi:transcription-repair coupling factor (superfamily II helicase)
MLAEEMETNRAIYHGEIPKPKHEVETAIEAPIDAYIPPEYIYDDMQKIEIYKKVASIQTKAETDDLFDELVDRFGDLPDSVVNLLMIARVKSACRQLGIATVGYKKGDLLLSLDKRFTNRIDGLKLFELCSQQFRDQVKLTNGLEIQICLIGKGKTLEQLFDTLEQFLAKYEEFVFNKEDVLA